LSSSVLEKTKPQTGTTIASAEDQPAFAATSDVTLPLDFNKGNLVTAELNQPST